MQIRNQNIKNNYISEIKKINLQKGNELENCHISVIKNWVDAHNARVSGGDPSLFQ